MGVQTAPSDSETCVTANRVSPQLSAVLPELLLI